MASKYNVGNLLFPKKFEKLFGYVLATFGIFGGFLEDFFEGKIFWRIFQEDFSGGFFSGGFFQEGILWEEFFVYIGIDLFVKILVF